MDLEVVNDLLGDLNIDTDGEDHNQLSTLAGAGDNDNERSLIIGSTEYVEAENTARKNRRGTGGHWKEGV
jgi:hypothetical protein